MKRERIVKQQAREALRGNFSILIAGFSALVVAYLTVVYLAYVIEIPAGVVDVESEEVIDSMRQFDMLVTLGQGFLFAALSPLLNGWLHTAARAVISGKSEITDMFYYFGSAVRYFKTVVLNLSLCVLAAALITPLEVVKNIFFNDDFGGAIMSAVMIVWGLFVYMILVHYPLFLYAVDDGKPVWHYAIGLVGFSFRHFGALLRLLFSMLGWIALCFFVVPVIYVAPYLITACANSARWLAIIEGMNVQLLPAAVHNGNDSL